MSLLAETIVEEFFNYHGFFTIRGIRKGHSEIDLLAIKVSNKKKLEALHIEVQVSEKPVKYISNLTEELRKKRGVVSQSSAIKRSDEELKVCVESWVRKKYNHPKIQELRRRLYPNAKWEFMLVHGNVKERKELDILKSLSVEPIDIKILIHNLASYYKKKYSTSSTGRDIVNLFKLFDITLTKEMESNRLELNYLNLEKYLSISGLNSIPTLSKQSNSSL